MTNIVKILKSLPWLQPQVLLNRLYPSSLFLAKEGRTAVNEVFKSFELVESEEQLYYIEEIVRQQQKCHVKINHKNEEHTIQVMCGSNESQALANSEEFVTTEYHDIMLADLMQSHMVQDFCIVGNKGCGKSALVKKFADVLGYPIEPIMLYQDMTSRDLLQQRTTLPNGDTSWRMSPLVTAALNGSLAVLDGLHRINPGTLSIINRLIHERELQLFDGHRLLRHDRYEELQQSLNLNDEEMKKRLILKIHPAFRIVALAEPPVVGSGIQQWINSELLTMFLFHHMRPLTMTEENQIIKRMVPAAADLIQPLLELTHKLRQSSDATLCSIASSLSMRQLLRIAHRLAQYPHENLYDAVQKACLARFLPQMARTTLDKQLEDINILPNKSLEKSSVEDSIICERNGHNLTIGKTMASIYDTKSPMKVPDVLFYENVEHLSIMEDMLKDFMLKEHLLLVGNQGVGKNKIVDRFLHLLNRPREYIQLHRDTTVQTLTLQPTFKDGIIMYEDSPLVRAVKLGHVLIVDEADKAPTNVTCILKTLVESGEMILSDGRRIVLNTDVHNRNENDIIVMHPDFRMIVLANRPGFPFLGNDFFGALGDSFSCHAIHNPNIESEMAMLQKYGPDVPENVLIKLVNAFSELRTMADQGLISYPYSTREVVNMVKHLQTFPNEGLVSVVHNIFDFDFYNKELQEIIIKTLHKHGIPLGADPSNIQIAKE